MAIKANPNRMELLRLKKRHTIAKRGHKLLKDKLDELMKQFLSLLHQTRDLREEIEAKLADAYLAFALARSEVAVEVIEEALFYPHAKVWTNVTKETLMGVAVPKIELKQEGTFDCYSLTTTPSLLDAALSKFSEILPLMLKLAELEKRVELLGIEIEKTRRRVNALEHVLIPQLEETIRMIKMKLDEMERSYRTQLMKIKEMVSESAI